MTLRGKILEDFGLPDVGAFRIEPAMHPVESRAMIKFTCEGRPPVLFDRGSVTKLAKAIRNIDPDLAGRLDACIEQAWPSS